MNSKLTAAAMVLSLGVLGWSVAMAAMGHAAIIATLAPVLGLTVTHVLAGFRSKTAAVPGTATTAVDEEDSAP
ncbi:hypothetical protein ACFVU3_39565 [Streptomyces sp. NPDC058052]|uniref:hypothetical protein n=1 Tax=Streptomyces sp. NPDC058052 TaxID=3346316 RepID=UPI0036EB77D3